MPEDEPKLTFGGAEVPSTPSEKPAAPPLAPPELPLIDQMSEHFEALRKKDTKIKDYNRRINELKYEIERLRKTIRFRETFLRRRSAQFVRDKYGIKIIPGYNDPETNTRREVAKLSRRTVELLNKAGVVIPTEFLKPRQLPAPK